MTYKNKQLISRLVSLSIFGLAIFGVLFFGQYLSKSPETASMVSNVDFIPSEEGKAVLVEFSDFQCPACGMYYPVVKQLKSEFGDKLKVVYKHFPLRTIHKNADLAARSSEVALIQGKFWEMHDLIFENQKDWADSGKALSIFTDYALSLGLDQEKFLADINLNSVFDKVNSDYQEGIQLKVNGTPTFFLNGKKITNPKSYDEFKQLIEIAIEQ